MKQTSEIELDCSRKCKEIVSKCELSGTSSDQCQNRYNQCVSKCPFA
ncbi:MAG: hypothetical protein ACOWWM_20170 [Desulfobacterales bacterium]